MERRALVDCRPCWRNRRRRRQIRRPPARNRRRGAVIHSPANACPDNRGLDGCGRYERAASRLTAGRTADAPAFGTLWMQAHQFGNGGVERYGQRPRPRNAVIAMGPAASGAVWPEQADPNGQRPGDLTRPSQFSSTNTQRGVWYDSQGPQGEGCRRLGADNLPLAVLSTRLVPFARAA